jgi:hypothetical protein
MTAYDIYVFVHVAGAVTWVGGNTITQINGRRIVGRNNPIELQGFIKDLVWLTPRFFIPISLLTVAFGIIAVLKGPWEFSDPFVSAGMAMFIVSFLIGIAYLGPQTAKLDALAEAGEADSPAYTKIVGAILLASAIELALLWATVFVMVVKPG